jgi:2-polyprenyl-3-methyl-5-hydroxy-6-metoxy-1,4-benzoquinol methylase
MSDKKQHYDEHYFRSRYGHLFGDPKGHGLLAEFWKEVIFDPLRNSGMSADASLLDYGSGPGVVSAALGNATCFDTSSWIQEYLRSLGRKVIGSTDEILRGQYDGILCSHSLEHYEHPKKALEDFRAYVRPRGFLILILPIETDYDVMLEPDLNQHLYAWTFQSISNLLRISGWTPVYGRRINGPFMLRTLSRILPAKAAISGARLAGAFKGAFPSMLVAARLES